jgi:predicted amidohydrolase YtcJ
LNAPDPVRILLGAEILTLDPHRPRVRALAVRGGRISAWGEAEELLAAAGTGAEVIDLGGGVAVPGFHDAHLHLSSGAVELSRLDLREVPSAEEVASRVGARAASTPSGSWIRGWGWRQDLWPERGWPRADRLDRAAPEHPVFLARGDGHAAWVNRQGLQRLGISRATPDPDGGAILRDGSGEPTGILLERAAEEARRALPVESEAERRLALLRAIEHAASRGVTAAQDVAEPWALPLWEELAARDALPLRVEVWIPLEHDRTAAEHWRRRLEVHSPRLRAGTLKVFLDGTLGSRSAALLEPYADAPGEYGALLIEPRDLRHELRRAQETGWAVAIHAIGDRAVRAALDGCEELRPGDRPHRIEHAQLVDPADLPRFAQLGAAASVQPIHLADDFPWVRTRIGDRRDAVAYPYGSLQKTGALLAFGSDWPVASLDPIEGMAAAVRRRAPGSSAPPLEPEEAVHPVDALAAYTAGPSRLIGRAHELGRLAPGCYADLVVLAGDPMAAMVPGAEAELPGVRSAWSGGRRIHPDPEAPSV